MDLHQAAAYFDRLSFENYDFSTGDWARTYFQGQLKVSDKFQTIYHRPTRKRMLYCAPGQEPSSPVIRIRNTGEVWMVGALQEDSYQDTHYRSVFALHKPQGLAAITRLAPTGSSGDPGWATSAAVETTWIDFELRSTNENEEGFPFYRSHYFLTLPSNCQVQLYDLITYNGQPYFVTDVYDDSSLKLCRAAKHIDPRQNFVYRRRGADIYSGGQVSKSYTDYNVTGRIGPKKNDLGQMSLSSDEIVVRILEGWIGVEPDMEDVIQIYGKDYAIKQILRDPTQQEWSLTVCY